jgi:DNA polymerase III delta prime subunit
MNHSSGSQADTKLELQSKLEHLINGGSERAIEVQTTLRDFLLVCASQDQGKGSISDAIGALYRQNNVDPVSIIMILRCLSINDVIPKPNQMNNIARYTVDLCEKYTPFVFEYLKIDSKIQTYQKFEKLQQCHNHIIEILSPIGKSYGDVEAILSNRKMVLGCLNHGFIQKYCYYFRLDDVRSTIEAILGSIKKIDTIESSFLSDIEECNRSIDSARTDFSGADTFLVNLFLKPFIQNCQIVLDDYFRTRRARFETTVIWGQHNDELQKRYPLHVREKAIQVVVPLRNSGPGLATDVKISIAINSEAVLLDGETVILGNVLPGNFSLTLNIIVIEPCLKFSALLEIGWGEIGRRERSSTIFEFYVSGQRNDVDWAQHELSTPYSTEVAKGEDFYGRDDMVRNLAARMLRDSMQSFFITGQKRVGKTSLALASAKHAHVNSNKFNINYHYILWGEIAHADIDVTLQQLSESIADFIFRKLPNSISSDYKQFTGSLSKIIKLCKLACEIVTRERFIIIIDEFDEIHPELYLYGNIAETFFANLRALSRAENVCIILIGGENMPFVMERQGQKLNNFARINLNYFSREREWQDFQLLVRRPSADLLYWHEDAISEVYNITRGNPYFTKIICSFVFDFAVSERDSDVTATEVRRATEAAISGLGANSFAHLWQDGISKALDERELDILYRMKVLVALARCIRQRLPTRTSNIAENRSSMILPSTQIQPILNDFQHREILVDIDREYKFTLPIFQTWLVDVGVSQLVSDSLREELASSIIEEENAALVKSNEIVELVDQWPTYRGMRIGTDDIRGWLQQVDNAKDQRLLFNLLKRTKVFSEAHVRERLKSIHATMVKPLLPEFIIRKRGARRTDVLLTYVDGEGKSGSGYASMYAEENSIDADCIISPSDFRNKYNIHASKYEQPVALIIIDDIAATGRTLSTNLEVFMRENNDIVSFVKIRIITLAATAKAQKSIDRLFLKLQNLDIDFRTCEIIETKNYALTEDSTVWNSQEERERTKSLCLDLGKNIYKDNPLGYGELGLLIVFPTTTPNNSLPILHSRSKNGSSLKWRPLFPRLVN